MIETGHKIHALRKENKLTQQELAQKLGLTPKMISFYERGQRSPSRAVLEKMSNIFDVSIDYLLSRTGDRRTPEALCREKYGFHYAYPEREELKEAFAQADKDTLPYWEHFNLCELDLRQYFSRSVESSAYNLYHIEFPIYAAMLLHQKFFKKRYGRAYEALAAKYPPRPGIPEGYTHYTPTEADQAQVRTQAFSILDMDEDVYWAWHSMPPHKKQLCSQLILMLAETSTAGAGAQ